MKYEFFSLAEIEATEMADPYIFTKHPEALEAATECIHQCLAKSQRSYDMAANALPGSPFNVVGTKRAQESIEEYNRWLKNHPLPSKK